MNITVLNGSPKGMTSVTMQYVLYCRNRFPQHRFTIIDISRRIKAIAGDPGETTAVADTIAGCDLVIWATPVYYLVVPSQYKRFIELCFSPKLKKSLAGKYAAVLVTSIHFFDHTAVNYLQGICDDLNMKYAGFFSPRMYDLVSRKGRAKLEFFANSVFNHVEKKSPHQRGYDPPSARIATYRPGAVSRPLDSPGKKTLVLMDSNDRKSNAAGMAETFRSAVAGAELYALEDVGINGGCLGCMKCAYDNNCTYGDSDGYRKFFEEKIIPADMIVMAGEIRDRYLSWRWKEFFDRSFYRNHTPSLKGKQVGFLVSGNLRENPNIREILDAYVEVQGANNAGFVSDQEKSRDVDRLITHLAQRMIDGASAGYVRPKTFLGVGGGKIFRDDVWGPLRMVFQADHRYYRKHGIYDFPQKNLVLRAVNAGITALLKIPQFRKRFYNSIKDEMLRPFRAYVER